MKALPRWPCLAALQRVCICHMQRLVVRWLSVRSSSAQCSHTCSGHIIKVPFVRRIDPDFVSPINFDRHENGKLFSQCVDCTRRSYAIRLRFITKMVGHCKKRVYTLDCARFQNSNMSPQLLLLPSSLFTHSTSNLPLHLEHSH